MEDLVVSRKLTIPAKELEVSFARSGGPGGQNVNKVNSKVFVRWNFMSSPSIDDAMRERIRVLGGSRVIGSKVLQLTCQTHRDQSKNIRLCLVRLKNLITTATHPVVPRKPTRPTLASKKRRLQEKKSNSLRKNSRSRASWET